MTNPKDAIGLTKPALRLVPPALTLHVSQAMANGAKKYGPYNWRTNSVRLTVYVEAAMRHLLELLDGEDTARDSGVHHAAHVAACMAIILDALETKNLIDDRATRGAASDIIERLTPAPPAKAPIPVYDSGKISFTFKANPVALEELRKSVDPKAPRGIQIGDVLRDEAGEGRPLRVVKEISRTGITLRDGGMYRWRGECPWWLTHFDGAPIAPPVDLDGDERDFCGAV